MDTVRGEWPLAGAKTHRHGTKATPIPSFFHWGGSKGLSPSNIIAALGLSLCNGKMQIEDEKNLGVHFEEKKEPKDIDLEEEEKETNFQISSRTFFLTYPHCELSLDEFKWAIYKEFGADNIKMLNIGREPHDGGKEWHFHVFLEFHHRFRSRNPRCFDIYWFHPNIQSAKQRNKVIAYVGKYIRRGYGYFSDMQVPLHTFTGFCRQQKDFEAWQIHLAEITKPEFSFPITAWGKVFQHEMSEKKRHYWFWGPANTGKSTNVGYIRFFEAGVRFFQPGEPQLHMGSYGTFDNYKGQRLVLYDDKDQVASIETLINLANVYGGHMETPIRGRGKDPIFDQRLVVFVIGNRPPVLRDLEQAFKARFYVVELDIGPDGNGFIKKIE